MPVWRKLKSGLITRAALGTLAALALLAPAARADFKITEIQPRIASDTVVVNGQLQLKLSRRVEEAVAKGIELPLIIEIRLYRKRSILWDEGLAAWSMRRNLQYHALSGQYLVNTGTNNDSFLSSTEALKYLGTLADLRLPLKDVESDPANEYVVKMRVYLDIESLPTPLRPVAYTTLSWHLNSGWTTWNVAR